MKACNKNVPEEKAHDPNVCGYTVGSSNGWKVGTFTRVHRDFSIILALRGWMGLPTNVKPEDVGLPSFCGNVGNEEI